MKNKQKARRSCALISAVLLCILAILPVLVIPAGAAATDAAGETVDTVPEDYVMIQWDYESYEDRRLQSLLSEFDKTWTLYNTSFYLETLYDEALTTKYYTGTLSMTVDFTIDWGCLSFAGSNIVSFGFGGDAPDINCSGAGLDEEPEFLRLYVPASALDSVRYFAVLSGGQIIVPEVTDSGDAYNAGYAAGEAAHADDYKNGFAAGQTDAMNSTTSLKDMIFSIFSAPADLINGILDFDLFGINLASLVKTLITLAVTALIVVFLIKLMRR